MTDNVPSPHSFSPWDIDNLRLTVFHPGRIAQQGLWLKLMGNNPEAVNERPREQVLVEEGGADGNRLVVTYQNQRLDWNILPIPPSSPDRQTPLILQDPDQALSLVRKTLDVSIQSYHLVDRLAFGVVLIRQVPDVAEGLGYLSQFLPQLDLVNRGGSDFIYQVNKPCRSPSAPHVNVNRIAKWSLETFQTGSFQIRPSSPPLVSAVSESLLMGRLSLDINTVPTNSATSVDRMPGLLDEFITFAQIIALQGDVA